MFNWWRSRIILRKKPKVEILLWYDSIARTRPIPAIKIFLKDIDIFTRQDTGFYHVEARLTITKENVLTFNISREHYERFMDLNNLLTWSFGKDLEDTSLWKDKGAQLKESTLTTYLYINDRKCKLTKSQKPFSVEVKQ